MLCNKSSCKYFKSQIQYIGAINLWSLQWKRRLQLFQVGFKKYINVCLTLSEIKYDIFFQCSVVCGWGIQKRSVKCVLEGNKTTLEPSSKVSGFEVSASEISSQCNKLAKPSSQKSCFVNCDTHWTFGNWSKVRLTR